MIGKEWGRPKGYRKNMTGVTCTKCNHFGLVLFVWNYATNRSSFKCIKCKMMFEK